VFIDRYLKSTPVLVVEDGDQFLISLEKHLLGISYPLSLIPESLLTVELVADIKRGIGELCFL
jgi:hypothetical protein